MLFTTFTRSCSRGGGGGGEQGCVCEGSSHPGEAAAPACLEWPAAVRKWGSSGSSAVSITDSGGPVDGVVSCLDSRASFRRWAGSFSLEEGEEG